MHNLMFHFTFMVLARTKRVGMRHSKSKLYDIILKRPQPIQIKHNFQYKISIMLYREVLDQYLHTPMKLAAPRRDKRLPS